MLYLFGKISPRRLFSQKARIIKLWYLSAKVDPAGRFEGGGDQLGSTVPKIRQQAYGRGAVDDFSLRSFHARLLFGSEVARINSLRAQSLCERG